MRISNEMDKISNNQYVPWREERPVIKSNFLFNYPLFSWFNAVARMKKTNVDKIYFIRLFSILIK